MCRKKPMKKILNNYYPEKVSVAEAFGKELRYYKAVWRSRFGNKGKAVRLLTFPELPGSKSIIFKVAGKRKWAMTNNPKKKVDFAIAWQDCTLRDDFPVLHTMSENKTVLNLHCNNILKTYVDEFFYEVFGYRTRIDPQLHSGPAVCKSEWNATHSGSIVYCPLGKAEEDSIYQIVINNRDENGFFEDIRVPVAGKVIPFVYIKLKSAENRFETKASKVFLKPASEYLSDDEQSKILRFAAIIGLDFGEVDVLRNRDDGRIYIVDVNNTPYGPPANLDEEGKRKAIGLLAENINADYCTLLSN